MKVMLNVMYMKKKINLSAERRSYQRRKRRERIPNDPEEISVAEVDPDLEFDETELAYKNLEVKVVGDEPVYCSSDAYSIETDSDDETRRDSRRVVFNKTVEKLVWQLGMVFENVNVFKNDVTNIHFKKVSSYRSSLMSLKR